MPRPLLLNEADHLQAFAVLLEAFVVHDLALSARVLDVPAMLTDDAVADRAVAETARVTAAAMRTDPA
jgi:hypothetical protein